MQIYVVKPGDTLFSIGRALGLAPGFLARYNGLQEPYRLAVGQSLLALYPEKAVTVRAGDTLSSIAASAGTDVLSLFRMNPNLSGSDRIYPGQVLVTQLEQNRTRSAFVAGYAYPYVQESVLRGILPFTGALMPFTYGFTPEGALVPMDDERLLALAEDYGVPAPVNTDGSGNVFRRTGGGCAAKRNAPADACRGGASENAGKRLSGAGRRL